MSVSILLSVVSAVLFYFSFPNVIAYQGFPFLAWVCLIPLFFALGQRSLFERLQLGMVFGFVSYVLKVQWLMPLSVIGCLLFVFVLMIQPVLFCVLSGVRVRSQRCQAVVIAMLWVAMEYARTLVLDGFVWGLGHSQSEWPVLIQIAEWTGVYGVSFLLVLVNYLFFATLNTRGALRHYGRAAFLIVVVVLLYGVQRMVFIDYHSSGKSIRVGVVQANINPKEKLDLQQYDHNVMEHMRLTKDAAIHQTDLVIWPETALVDDYVRDNKWRYLITKMIQNMKTQLLIGSATLEQRQDFNSALLLDRRGVMRDVYHKHFLVPFTEYVPQQPIFQLLENNLNLTGFRFQAGQQPGLMSVTNKAGDMFRFGLAICSETGYPALYRTLAASGAQFYVSMLNDGWFQQKAALMIHLSQDVFRAVENRIPVVRSANTGVSTHIRASGRIASQDRLPLMARTHGVFDVRIHERPLTVYTLWGDLFAMMCMMMTLAAVSVFVSVKLMGIIFRKK